MCASCFYPPDAAFFCPLSTPQQGKKKNRYNLMNAFYSLGMSLECQPLP